MPIVTKWYVEGRVVIAHVIGDITVSDMQQHGAEITALFDSGQPPVHWLNDCHHMGNPNVNLKALQDLYGYMKHPNLAWIVTFGLGSNGLGRFAATALTKTLKLRARTFSDHVQALEFLRRQDSSLDFNGLNPPLYHP